MSESQTAKESPSIAKVLADLYAEDTSGLIKDAIIGFANAETARFDNLVDFHVQHLIAHGRNVQAYMPTIENVVRSNDQAIMFLQKEGALLTHALDTLSVGKGILKVSAIDVIFSGAAVYSDYKNGENWVSELFKQGVSFAGGGYIGALAVGALGASASVVAPVIVGAIVTAGVSYGIGKAWDFTEEHWDDIGNWTSAQLTAAETAINTYALDFKGWAIDQRDLMSANIDAAAATFSKWLDEKVKYVSEVADYASQHADEIGAEIVNFWADARKAAQDAADTAREQMSNFAIQAKEANDDFWNGVTEWAKGAFATAKENLKDFNGDIVDLFGDTFKGLDDLATDLAKGLGGILEQIDPRDLITSDFGKLVDAVKALFQGAEEFRCPIVLDLDGDGIETVGFASGVHFDHDGNGFAELTGWVAPDDGLLVFDRSGNGDIDNGSELFGNYSLVGNETAQNGFVALGLLDSNKDNNVTAADRDFSKLRVWRDADSDGVVDSGELMTLAQAGIKSLSTSYAEGTAVDKNGNKHLQIGKFTTTDGKTREMTDVWFDVNTTKTVDKTTVAVSAAIAKLPDIVGSGNVASLQQAMARDSAGKLAAAVQKYLGLASSGEDTSGLVHEIIYRWAGVYDVDPSSRSTANSGGVDYLGDARKLEAIEAFVGDGFDGQFGSTPGQQATQMLLDAFDKLVSFVSAQLDMETRAGEYLDLIKLSWQDDTSTLEADVSALVNALMLRYAEDREGALVDIGRLVNALKNADGFGEDVLARLRAKGNPDGTGLSSVLATVGLKDSEVGSAGADAVQGADGNDIILGFGGNDRLHGGDGNDRIVGGGGDDILSGEIGADTYVFNRGDGRDTISNWDNDDFGRNKDTLEFGKDIKVSDVEAVRDGFDVVLKIKGTNDVVRVVNFLVKGGTDANAIELFKFADGTVWTAQKVMGWVGAPTNEVDYLIGTASADTIKALAGNDEVHSLGGNDNIDGGDVVFGEAGNDTLEGGKDDDSLWGGDGNDTLVGGAGDDYLMGGMGSDTYSFAIGWGKDTINDNSFEKLGVTKKDVISFAEGIAPSDITVWRNETNDLVLSHTNGNDQIVVAYEFLRNNNVDEVRFADGTVWDVKKISSMVDSGSKYADYLIGDASDTTMNGREGNDTVVGGDGNETIVGGIGNDHLDGREGSDIYQFELGWGHDIVSNAENGGSLDFIIFGAGVDAADVAVCQVGLDMVLEHRNGDTITVKAHYGGSSYQIDEVRFHNGTIWDVANLAGLPKSNKAPVISSNGGDAKASVSVAEGKTSVTTVQATDTDVGAKLKYAIVGAADAGKFVINAATGVLAFKSAADFEKPADSGRNNVYDVVVRVTDNGGKSDEQVIAVAVTNVNEAPVIANSGGGAVATIKIAENGGAVTVMQAYDADKNAPTWSLSGADAHLFVIDAKSGKLTFKAAPDYEAPKDEGRNNSYEVTVKVSDGKLTDTQSLTVAVTDVKGKVVNGTSLADMLLGTVENDTLDGKRGADTMTGGNGNDIYVVDNTKDKVVEKAGEGIDLANSGVSYALSANVENLTLIGSAKVNGTGNTSANIIIGNGAENIIKGEAGNDTLLGAGGSDNLSGGDGSDRLEGGIGADILTGGNGKDTFVFAAVKDSLVPSRDTITDFDGNEGDRIDLTGIDANLGLTGDHGFAFIGTAGFSKKAGELRYDKATTLTVAYGDVDGDGKADFAVQFNDSITLSKDYFFL